MKKLQEVFKSAAFRDHAKGAAMGVSAGLLFGPKAAAVCGFMGLVMGAEMITDMFNSAVQGRQMAHALAPALIQAHTPSR